MVGKRTLFTVGLTIIVISGMFIGSGLFQISNPVQSNGVPSSQTRPYELTMIITDDNWFNGSAPFQSSFFVLQNNTLVSPANLYLPADTKIVVTIVNYDDGIDTLSQPLYANVMGTAGESVYVANLSGLTMSILSNPSSIASQLAGYNMTVFSPAEVSHSFTIIDGNTFVNIPVMPHSVETTSFALPPGNYIWQCECACGATPNGWGGAMVQSGWMNGVVHVG